MRMNEVYKTSDINPMSNAELIPTEVQIQKMKSQSQKQKRNDRNMLVVIFIIGLVGFNYVFFWGDSIHSKSEFELDAAQHIAATKLPTQEGKKINLENQLTIKGIFEANEKLQFVLDSYNDEVVYTLRFGNGNGEVLKGKVTEYVYPASGIFKVTLEARYKKEEVIMHNEYISIDDAITIVEGAFNEQI